MTEKNDVQRLLIALVTIALVVVIGFWLAGQLTVAPKPTASKAAMVTPTPTPTIAPPEAALAYQNSASKTEFVERLLPLIEAANEQILADRSRALALIAAEDWYNPWLIEQFRQYRVGLSDELLSALENNESLSQADLAALAATPESIVMRMDVIPASLALAQSANESAWGRSRFATEGSNYFGQWCFSEGCGIVPEGRPEGETYEVRAFDSVADSVAAYMLNLNRHWAYERLRALRAQQRQFDVPVSGIYLAGGLERYSVRGTEYIDELRDMIWVNDFDQLD